MTLLTVLYWLYCNSLKIFINEPLEQWAVSYESVVACERLKTKKKSSWVIPKVVAVAHRSGRLRPLFIIKSDWQFKRGFTKVVVTRTGRLRQWSQGEGRLYIYQPPGFALGSILSRLWPITDPLKRKERKRSASQNSKQKRATGLVGLATDCVRRGKTFIQPEPAPLSTLPRDRGTLRRVLNHFGSISDRLITTSSIHPFIQYDILSRVDSAVPLK